MKSIKPAYWAHWVLRWSSFRLSFKQFMLFDLTAQQRQPLPAFLAPIWSYARQVAAATNMNVTGLTSPSTGARKESMVVEVQTIKTKIFLKTKLFETVTSVRNRQKGSLKDLTGNVTSFYRAKEKNCNREQRVVKVFCVTFRLSRVPFIPAPTWIHESSWNHFTVVLWARAFGMACRQRWRWHS